MKKFIKLLLLIFVTVVVSCKKDKNEVPNPQPPANESEVITTLKLLFTDSANTSNVSEFVFDDPDGDGGNAATQHDTIQLADSTTYLVSIVLLDKTKNPVDTISNEVEEEADEHQFFFNQSGTGINTTYLDKDVNNLPIGLLTKWKTVNTTMGSMQVILKHQPGVKNNSQAAGETDVEVLFQVKVM